MDYYMAKYENKVEDITPVVKAMEAALALLDVYLASSKFVAADTLTLADFTNFVTIACYKASAVDLTKFPNVNRWFELCKSEMSGYEAVKNYIDDFNYTE